jgi:hypothetical protein
LLAKKPSFCSFTGGLVNKTFLFFLLQLFALSVFIYPKREKKNLSAFYQCQYRILIILLHVSLVNFNQGWNPRVLLHTITYRNNSFSIFDSLLPHQTVGLTPPGCWRHWFSEVMITQGHRFPFFCSEMEFFMKQ